MECREKVSNGARQPKGRSIEEKKTEMCAPAKPTNIDEIRRQYEGRMRRTVNGSAVFRQHFSRRVSVLTGVAVRSVLKRRRRTGDAPER